MKLYRSCSCSLGAILLYEIPGIDPERFTLGEIGSDKWFIKNTFYGQTPKFDNKENVIVRNNDSFFFLGKNNGKSKLYIVEDFHYNIKRDDFYKEVEMEGNPKEIEDVDSRYILVNSEKGDYFYDVENLKRTSAFFDKIYKERFYDETYKFEKILSYKEKLKMVTGTVSCEGEITISSFNDYIEQKPKKKSKRLIG